MAGLRRAGVRAVQLRCVGCNFGQSFQTFDGTARMKNKYEGKDLQGLVDLGREQGYLTFDQVNDFLPQDVASPTDLRAALESFEDMDIKVLDEVPTAGEDSELEAEGKEEPEEAAEPAAEDSLAESSDPVRLYLKEMGNFQLLSREQEVEIA